MTVKPVELCCSSKDYSQPIERQFTERETASSSDSKMATISSQASKRMTTGAAYVAHKSCVVAEMLPVPLATTFAIC